LTRKKAYKNKEESKGKDIVSYECRKPRHIKPECPSIKKKKGKFEKMTKALKVETRSDTECELTDEEGNPCLMVESKLEEDEVKDSKLSDDELQDFLKEMFEEH